MPHCRRPRDRYGCPPSRSWETVFLSLSVVRSGLPAAAPLPLPFPQRILQQLPVPRGHPYRIPAKLLRLLSVPQHHRCSMQVHPADTPKTHPTATDIGQTAISGHRCTSFLSYHQDRSHCSSSRNDTASTVSDYPWTANGNCRKHRIPSIRS